MKKKIAFISEHASPLATLGGVDSGGQNVYVAELVRHLARMGYHIDIYTRKDKSTLPEIYHWAPGVRVVNVSAGPAENIPKEQLLQHMPAFRDYMISFIKAERIQYELIHANFFMSAWVAMEIKKLLCIPFVVTFHALGQVRKIYQADRDTFPEERLQIEEAAVTHADGIIAECPQDYDDLVNYYQAPPEKMTVIPCGFSAEEFYPVERKLARKIVDVNPDDKVILQLGRMVPRKGVDNVVRSLSRMDRNVGNVKLFIVGGEGDKPDPATSPEIARLMQIAAGEGVSDQVIFTGRKSRILLKYYYSAADIFVTTPWYEPFGITPLEAMACGVPVVGANVGGIKYSVADGVTGLLVPPNDPEALANKVSHLLSDAALMKRMKLNAIKRVNTMFTWMKVAAGVSRLYEQVLETTPRQIETGERRKTQVA
jgi:D-inositol-3-phosphate glycosyltransferase